MEDPTSEALRDRIMRDLRPLQPPRQRRNQIYNKLLASSGLDSIHIAPLTLPAVSAFAVLSRLDPPANRPSPCSKAPRLRRTGSHRFSREAVAREKRDHPSEGMKGISPRSVMNRLSARAGLPDVECMSPLNALDSNLARTNRERQPHPRRVRQLHKLRPGSGHRIQRTRLPGRPEGVRRTLRANRRSPALRLPHRRERRHRSRRPTTQGIRDSENGMRAMEKPLRISERDKNNFRMEIRDFFEDLKRRGVPVRLLHRAAHPRVHRNQAIP